MLEALRTESQALLDEQAAADPTFARVLESQRAFSAEYATWRDLAYPAAAHGSAGPPQRPGDVSGDDAGHDAVDAP